VLKEQLASHSLAKFLITIGDNTFK